MITKEQIEEELFLALEELENSEELTEFNALKSASNWLQRLKGRRRSTGSGDGENEEGTGTGDGDRRRRGQRQAAGDADGDTGSGDAGSGDAGTGEGGEGTLPKDTPVSVMKKQKGVVVGQGGQKEAPLVMHIQKMGLSQSTAQAIAKRVGQYLQQRKIPIAEVVARLDESKFSDVTSHMLGKMRIDLKNPRDSDKASANYAMAAHQVAKKGDPEKFRSFVMKRVEPRSKNIAKIMQDADEEMLKKLMNYILTSDKMKAYHELGKKYRETKAAEKEQGRQSVRALGKDKGAIGKIVSRFVGDNQQLINKDPGLKATLDDPVKFNKLAKSIRDMLRRQLKRRGYEAAQIKNVLESVEPTLTLLREQRS